MMNEKKNCKMNKIVITVLVLTCVVCGLLMLAGCGSSQPDATEAPAGPTEVPQPTTIPINESGTTVKDRFVPPDGYTRVEAEEGSFAAYLQNFQLKPYGEVAYYYDASVNTAGGTLGVFDQDVTRWQQCADSIMRLYAEYLYEKGDYDKIAFNFTTGFVCDFKSWSEGKRVKIDGSKCTWVDKAEPSTDHSTLEGYLDFVYQYANTESLQNQMTQVVSNDVQIGDCFVITSWQMNENLGHAVFVADMAVNEAGQKLYLIFEGTTPASQICLAKSNDTTYGYWLPLAEDGTLSITKTVFDEETQEYKDKTWTCPGQYIRRFTE